MCRYYFINITNCNTDFEPSQPLFNYMYSKLNHIVVHRNNIKQIIDLIQEEIDKLHQQFPNRLRMKIDYTLHSDKDIDSGFLITVFTRFLLSKDTMIELLAIPVDNMNLDPVFHI